MNKKLFLGSLSFCLIFISYFYFDKSVAYFFHQENFENLKHIMKIITKFGEAQYFIILSLLLWFFTKDKKYSFLFFSVVMSGILVNIIKIILARYRPIELFHNNLYGFSFFDIGYKVNSFPSGHTTTAFSGFVALSFMFPKYKYLFILCAFLIGFSRIILTHHYISDVIGGIMLGIITTYLIFKYKSAI